MLNPLVRDEAIKLSPSVKGGMAPALELHLRILAAEILQKAGRSLRLPQPTIATAQVLMHRFYFEASMIVIPLKDIILGTMILACKISETPRRHRDIINAIYYMMLFHQRHENPAHLESFSTEYRELENRLYASELYILRRLGFHVHVVHPYIWAVNYLRVLGLTTRLIVQTTWNFLNDSYRTIVHCMHPPNVIATACIFLASREMQIAFPKSWHLIFDVRFDDMMHVATHIQAIYAIRLRWDLPLCTKKLASWVTPHVESQLTLAAYTESLQTLEKRNSVILPEPEKSCDVLRKESPPVEPTDHLLSKAKTPKSSPQRTRSRNSEPHHSGSRHSRGSSYRKYHPYKDRRSTSASRYRSEAKSDEFRSARRSHSRKTTPDRHYREDKGRDLSRGRGYRSTDRYSSKREDTFSRSHRH